MASTQTAPANIPGLAQVMAALDDHHTTGTHEEQNYKLKAHNLDTTHLSPTIPCEAALSEEKLKATLHSHQSPTPTPTPTTTPTTSQPAPLPANTPSTIITLQPQAQANPIQNFCYCLRPEDGEMIGCDNPSCEREWFHLPCTEFNRKPLPSAQQPWFCIPCRGWQAELERGEPGKCDAIWRCPKCGYEIVHEDDWLRGGTSQEPVECEGCGLEKGDRWEPRNMRH